MARAYLWLRLHQQYIVLAVSWIPILLLVGLVLVVVWMSFQVVTGSGGTLYSLQGYVALYSDPLAYEALKNTAVLCLVCVVTALFFGVVSAWLVERTDLSYKHIPFSLMTLGMLMPGFMTAMGWVFLLHPRIGLINTGIASISSMEWARINIATAPGMGFVQGLGLTPIVFLMVAATFRANNPVFEEAAAVHGVGLFRRIWRVSLPLAFPGILAAGIYILTIGIAAFDVPAVIGLANRVLTFSTFLYLKVVPQDGVPKYEIAGAFSVLMIAIALVLSWLYFRVVRQSHRYAVITGQAYRPKPVELGRWSICAWIFLGTYFLLSLILPLLVVLWNSLLPYTQVPSWSAIKAVSLANYQGLPWAMLIKGAKNTGILMFSVATLALFFSLAISWTVTRSGLRGSFFLDTGAFLPHVIPSISLALGAVFAALVFRNFLPIYGTIFILMGLYVVVWISFGSRMMNSALLQIHKELEEAGQVAGLSLFRRIWKILLPLLAMALRNSWLWIALLVYRELSMASLLVTTQNLTLPIVIWSIWLNASFAKAAAAAFIGFVFVTPLIFLYWFFGRRVGLVGGPV